MSDEPSWNTWPDSSCSTASGEAFTTDASVQRYPSLASLTTTRSPLATTVEVPLLEFVRTTTPWWRAFDALGELAPAGTASTQIPTEAASTAAGNRRL